MRDFHGTGEGVSQDPKKGPCLPFTPLFCGRDDRWNHNICACFQRMNLLGTRWDGIGSGVARELAKEKKKRAKHRCCALVVVSKRSIGPELVDA